MYWSNIIVDETFLIKNPRIKNIPSFIENDEPTAVASDITHLANWLSVAMLVFE